MIYLAWIVGVLMLSCLLNRAGNTPLLCWLFGCNESGGGWCLHCLRDFQFEYKGPVWARRKK